MNILKSVMNKYDKKHLNNLTAVQRQVEKIFDEAAREAARLGVSLGEISPDKAFSFTDYPATSKKVETLLNSLKTRLSAVVTDGIKAAWTLSNTKNDELVRSVFGSSVIDSLTREQKNRYLTNNSAARDAFLQRKSDGLNLSDRVWRYTDAFKDEIELALDVGLRTGTSADDLSRDVRQYLRYPDKLFRRVKDSDGVFHLSRPAAAFHPGQGVYRSSYMNARRLAATETNIAYRTSDYLRWQQLDFVVGIHVILSNNHTIKDGKGRLVQLYDICDELSGRDESDTRGRYPKTFKFTGWHPHCRCHAISILKTEDELAADNQRILDGEEPSEESVNTVPRVPEEFNTWIDKNRERAKGWSSLPYFIKDNPEYAKEFKVNIYSDDEKTFTRALRTNAAMNEILNSKYFQELYPELENTEKASIFYYTQGDTPAYRRLNKQLWKDKESLSPFDKAFSEILSAALEKLPAYEGTVYRTVRLNRTLIDKFFEMAENKQSMIFEGFTSTSKEISAIENFVKSKKSPKSNETDAYLVLKSKSGHEIEQLSQFSGRYEGKINQREVLFVKGLNVKFEKYKIIGKTPVFYLTEI
ncbi:MAG: ADP-ribosyltransferase [Clostridia bacterium]|nr:ADP-ribosyltransferase [Clostridia bacterium]